MIHTPVDKQANAGPADSTQGAPRSTGSGAFGKLPPGEPLEAASASQPISQVASRAKSPDMATPHGPQGISGNLPGQQLPPQLPDAAVSHLSGAAQQPMGQSSAQGEQTQDQGFKGAVVGAVKVETPSSVPLQTTPVMPVLALGELSGKKKKSSLGACCLLFPSVHRSTLSWLRLQYYARHS